MKPVLVLLLLLSTSLAAEVTTLELGAHAGIFHPTHSLTHTYDQTALYGCTSRLWTDYGLGTETAIEFMHLRASNPPGVLSAENAETELEVLPVLQTCLFRVPFTGRTFAFIGTGMGWYMARERLTWLNLATATYEDAHWRDDTFGWHWMLGCQARFLRVQMCWREAWFSDHTLHTYHCCGSDYYLNGWSLTLGISLSL